MHACRAKPISAVDRGEGLIHLGAIHVHHPAAPLAYQVVVITGRGEVDDPGTVTEVDMVDEAEPLQRVDGPVDGGGVDSSRRAGGDERRRCPVVQFGHGDVLAAESDEHLADGRAAPW